MALGADRGILVETTDEIGALEVAKILKGVVDAEKPELILLGKQAIDDDSNQVGQMLGALLGAGQGTFASEVKVDGGKVQVTREIDGGLQTVELALPAIITTDLRLNEPRYAALPNIMKARKNRLIQNLLLIMALQLVLSLKLLKLKLQQNVKLAYK